MKYWFWANSKYPEIELFSRYNFSNWQQGVLNWLVACHMTEPACLLMNRVQWFHDDVIKWKHFPRYWPSLGGTHRSPVDSPHKGQWRGALMFYLICTWTNSWVNNRDAGDLRRHGDHYGVTVMSTATRYTCAINLFKVTDATNSKCNSLCHNIAKRHGRSVLRYQLTTRFKVGAKIPRPKVEGFLPPPRTEWWVNCAIPTAHVVLLLSHTLFG